MTLISSIRSLLGVVFMYLENLPARVRESHCLWRGRNSLASGIHPMECIHSVSQGPSVSRARSAHMNLVIAEDGSDVLSYARRCHSRRCRRRCRLTTSSDTKSGIAVANQPTNQTWTLRPPSRISFLSFSLSPFS
jgi:hypothetical protein